MTSWSTSRITPASNRCCEAPRPSSTWRTSSPRAGIEAFRRFTAPAIWSVATRRCCRTLSTAKARTSMASGRLAGETVIHAKETEDFSERRLQEYKGKLDNSWIMADMRKYDKAVPLLEHNPQLLTKYPEIADPALDELFRDDGTSKWENQSKILKMVRKEGGLKMVWDSVKAAWAMK